MPRRPGFCVGLYYVALDSVELNIERVKRRVEKGGHDIPADVIDRRYWGSLDKLSSALKYADEALLIDNSGLEPREVCRVTAGKILLPSAYSENMVISSRQQRGMRCSGKKKQERKAAEPVMTAEPIRPAPQSRQQDLKVAARS